MRLFVSLLFLVLPLCAQPPEGAKQDGAKKGQRQPPKNLKILSPDGLIPTMRLFASSLGGNCETCHVQGDFASDENPHKEIARKMILMTREINGKFPDGKEHVTCYTCHRGSHEPAMVAPPKPADAKQ